MAHTGMTKDQFKIGEKFWTGSGEWVCTDIGTRVIVAKHEYHDTELVFDDLDFGGCSTEPFDKQ